MCLKSLSFISAFADDLRSCLMHGSETWPMKVEHELKLNHVEMSMVRWMCGDGLDILNVKMI